jgi:Protein of unknown function (DUF1553)/Protein of unknown function (DUF1549)/Planctomycete cytochrome C
MNSLLLRVVPLLACVTVAQSAAAEDPRFFRGIVLNGPALSIDGNAWEGKDAKDFSVKGKVFENQNVTLKPATDTARARMIRASRWGDKVDVTIANVPSGAYQVFLYVWEDNHSERFDVLVNGHVVEEGFHSGSTGMWKRLGPWPAESVEGKITVAARAPSHGAANLSGVEIWSGSGASPASRGAEFVSAPTPEQVAFFESKIRPVLAEQCYKCHSAKAEKIKGGLVLDSRAGVVKGGDTGAAIAPGDVDASLLIQAIRHLDEDLAMPPKKKLPPEQIAALEEWVKMGAPDPRTENTVAVVQAKTAIDWTKARDRFILARIEAAGLKPTADAEARTFIRRSTFDLTGLPPTPAEVEAFVADSIRDPQAATRNLIDRLLASPAYGERWGRYWLDVVRYADTAGDNSDFPIPQMHKYRDWVIAAFNRDLPYDQFVREQIAGDLLPKRTPEQIIATGYIANSRRFGSRVDDYPQHLTIEDTLDNFGRAFLGLTINCARCHDHKFDPITAQDYYALYGIFHSTRYPWPGIELEQKQRDFVPLVASEKLAEAEAAKKARDSEISRLEKEVQKLKDSLKKTAAAGKKTVEGQIKDAEKAVSDFKKKPLPYELAYAVADAKRIADAPVQMKGDPAKPGEVVRRRFLTVLGGAEMPPDDRTSGRLRLAEWLLDKSNPLPARVMVNRIWQQHFGKGLVPTPNDFGKQGKPPTHPELLDWLASRFIADGWSVKKMHRIIMLSRTYSLAGTRDEEALAKDPGNTLLASFPRRRLDAESIRDTLLTLGGTLDRTPGGEHPFPPQSDWKFTQHNPFKATYETNKRSVYLMTQRIQRHPYLAIFDGADPSTSTPARPTSTTPLQALFLLNDPLVHEQSKRFAARILAERPDDPARLQLACALAFSRPASDSELADAQAFLANARAKLGNESAAWEAMVRVLFRLNEFVYLD